MGLFLAVMLASLAAPADVPATIDYPVPPFAVCAFWCKVAARDLAEIDAALGIVREEWAGTVAYEDRPLLPPWRRQQLELLRAEAHRVRAVWDAAWYVALGSYDVDECDRRAGYLRDLLGAADYAAGRLPLPLSCR